MALTERMIAELGTRGRVYRVADGRGLFLEVRPTGLKQWVYRYRMPLDAQDPRRRDGRDRKDSGVSLGVWPHVKAAQARVRLQAARDQVQAGREPAHVAAEAREHTIAAQHAARRARDRATAGTVAAIAEEWFTTRARTPGLWCAKRRGHVRHWIDESVVGPFGDRPLADVTAADLLGLVQTTQAIHPSKARRVKWVWSQVFRSGIIKGFCSGDPTVAIGSVLGRRQDQERHHPRLTAATIPDYLRAVRAHPHPWARVALELVLLLFQRPSELREARWAEFDLAGATWRIPAARMKERRDHIVPLSRQAIALLKAWAPAAGASELVFPSPRATRTGEPMAAYSWQRAVWTIGYKGAFTLHGARGTANTLLRELGADGELVERQQAHAVGGSVQRAYDFAERLADRRRLMQSWADYLDALVEGKRPTVLVGRFGR